MRRFLAFCAALSPVNALQLPNMPKNPFKNKADGATVVRLQLAFNVMERDSRSVLRQLEQLADNADASTNQGIERLAADTALLLMRRRNEWLSCGGSVRHFSDDDTALRQFDREVNSEAAKFERENSFPLNSVPGSGQGKATVAVVMAVACLMGDCEDEVLAGARAAAGEPVLSGDAAAAKRALEEMASAGPGEVFAFELMWVPDDNDESLSMDDIIMDWPELVQC